MWLLHSAQEELGVHVGSLRVRDGLSVCVPGGHWDPVGVHMCGRMTSESHSWERWPGGGHRCSPWLGDMASLLLTLQDFFPSWNRAPENTSHSDKTYKVSWGFEGRACIPVYA